MHAMLRGLGAAMALVLLLTGCASAEFAAVNTEPGYYYGFGTGSTEAAAQAAAFQDLVYNTFTQSGSVKKDTRLKAALPEEMKAALVAVALKPFSADKKSATSFSAVYRVKFADWTKAEATRLSGLQSALGGRFQAVTTDTKKSLGDRLADAGRIAKDIDKNGATFALKVGGADSALLGDAIAKWAQAQVAGAQFQFQPAGGLVGTTQPVTVTLTAAGKPLAGMPLTAVWSTESLASTAVLPVTDAKGVASIPYPGDDKFRNQKPVLKVSTRLAAVVDAAFLTALDAGVKGEASYRNAVTLVSLKADEVKVDGGTFTVGSVKQDRRAGSNEKPRTVTVATFFIDRTLVTNGQYRAFLRATDVPQDQWPDFLDGDQGGQDQPVVGVSLADAQKYAQWVSGQLGVAKRLPTEDEYEIAARAGQSTIFPWGDQPPTDGVRANYSGNKKFASTSPVGSFPNGANPLGLVDMVGNVWEWTTSAPVAGMTADPGSVIIKGGSWLDGPNELRISNHRAVDPTETASDRGFRLVRSE